MAYSRTHSMWSNYPPMQQGTPITWTTIPASSEDDAVDEYIRRNP